MTSRRTLLLGAIGALASTRLLAACDGAANDAVAPLGSSPPVSPVSSPASSTPVSSAPAVSSPAVAWAGADFGALDAFLAETNGEAFAVWEGGVMIHEWYRSDDGFVRDVASAQKSMLSLLIGRAVGDGLVGLDTPIDDILGQRWTPHGQSAGISVMHLLAMTSGLDDSLSVVAAPGERWLYSGAFSVLFDVLTTVTRRELDGIAADWLFAPAGAKSSTFYERSTGRFAPIGLRSTVPDLLALGRLVLEGGPPGLADGWLQRSFGPSNSFNRSYGLLWWLPDQPTFMLPGPGTEERVGPMVPSAPADTVAAWGKDDQKLYISPGQRLVVARLGGRAVPRSQAAWSSFDTDLWDRLADLRG